MTDGEALLAAIIANRDDDTPRLVYADYLEEYGQGDRAEFIRVQCEMARLVEPNMSIVGTKGGTPILGCDECRSLSTMPRMGNDGQVIEGMLSLSPTPCRYHHLKRRSDLLISLASDEGGWVFDVVSIAPGVILWKRGFPAAMSMLACHWIEHGDEWYRTMPLERIVLSGMLPSEWLPARFQSHWPAIIFDFDLTVTIGIILPITREQVFDDDAI
jgi:uncharacterized protein (TIGR02996 family)